MPILVITVLATSSLTLLMAKPADAGQTPAELKGIVNSDTIWTKANSPYILTGNVLVSNNVTLTIEAGTVVNFNSLDIMVNGTLVARGNSPDRVVFYPGQSPGAKIIFTNYSSTWNAQSNSGTVIEKALLDSITILINGGSPKIANNVMDECKITVSSGFPIVENNSFLYGQITIEGGTPVIKNNIMQGLHVDESGFWQTNSIVINSGQPIISKNCIYQADIGIEIKGGDPVLTDNNITLCKTGVSANVGTLERNFIDGVITGNATFRNNTIGYMVVEASSFPSITFNNLGGIRLASLQSQASADLNATNNWWGTIDAAEIDQKIWDYSDDFDLGRVNYTPFLTQSNPYAVPDANAPIPTPTLAVSPTSSPSIDRSAFFGLGWLGVGAVTVVVAALLAVGLLVYFKKHKRVRAL